MVAASKNRFTLLHTQHSLGLFASLTLVTGMSCQKAVRSDAIIDAYRRADCVVPIIAPGIEPPTRGWDTTITIPDGSKATIEGADKVGGNIFVRYEPGGRLQAVVQPGDYIYPSDVRLNPSLGRLYVKASGLAGGISQETWLYEYDLQKRKQVRKRRVHPAVLPQECDLKK